MSKSEVIILIAAFIFAGFRIYQKYFGKNSKGQGKNGSLSGNASFSEQSDDYEPYSGKQ